MSKTQITFVNLEDLVDENHTYRKFYEHLDFSLCEKALGELDPQGSFKGYGITRLFKVLVLQFMEDFSDRDMERYLQDSNAAKWFCDFGLTEKTPDHTVFSRTRKRIGTKRLSTLFGLFQTQLREAGYLSNVFTFIDSTHLIAKASLWEEKDKLEEMELNNKTVSKVAADKDARFGCKGKKKHWYGYKKHVSVDIQSGLINKVAVTQAHLSDGTCAKHVMPNGGAVYADKGYCGSSARRAALRKGVHLCAIKRNNMKSKNKDLDKYYTKIRSPYERVFSKDNKRTRYRGLVKTQFQAFMTSLCFNLKRVVVIESMSVAA